MAVNERQIALKKGGNYTTLDAYMDRRSVVPLPFNEDAAVAVSGTNVIEIDSAMTVASTLALGIGTVESGGLFATLLAGAVGTGAITSTSDSLGNILNMVKIRDASTHDPITEAGGREVYALVQAVSTAVDGDAIGASGSENTQLSFVYVASDGTLTLTSVTATVEFGQNNVYTERDQPTIFMHGGNPTADALSVDALSATQGEYSVTTAFTAGEVVTLATGAGASAGVTTKTGDTIALGASGAAFNDNNLLEVHLNGVLQRKGTDVIWDSSGTCHFVLALDVTDQFEIRLLA